MKKIGIITYYNAINNGAFLQAFALQEYLYSKGFTALFLPICEFSSNKIKKDKYISEYTKELSALHKKMPTGDKDDCYDILIYGSDEIWNLRNKGWNPKSWGFGYKAKVRISYAPCVGNTKISDFLLFPYTLVGLKKFTALSVRDSHSHKIISRLSKKNIETVLDPTFLISYERYKQKNTIGKYVLIYTYGLDAYTTEQIKSTAKRNNWKTVCTGSYCDWADMNIPASPFEWVALIYNAEYVITSTFHGTVFSIICNKQFSVVNTISDKVCYLLKQFNLQNRKITNLEKIIPQNNINYEETNRLVRILKEKSEKYLMSNMNIKV